jgi:hypothetical protein
MPDPPHGFELFLSHSYTGAPSHLTSTIGFYKSTQDYDITANISHLRESSQEIFHPMLLPILITCSNIGAKKEKSQRKIRTGLRINEKALISYDSIDGHSTMSLADINRNLLWYTARMSKNAAASNEILDTIDFLLRQIHDNHKWGSSFPEVELYKRYQARITFTQKRLQSIEGDARTIISKTEMQRAALHNILLNRQTETALLIERRQKLEDERKFRANQTWNRNQRTIGLLGVIFLPGAFLAVC